MKMILKAVIAMAVLGASACAGMPAMPAKPAFGGAPADIAQKADVQPAAAVMPDIAEAAPKDTVARAADLLAAGKEAEAKAVLQAVLAVSPRDMTAQNFLRQIDTDPVKLLGEASAVPYIVQTGDTMSGLADRFLGDGRLFYALSRYNGLTAPNALSVGRALKLPVTAKRTAPASTAATSASASVPKAAAAKANDMRLQALQLLNKGEVDGAIALLKQAVALDANAPAIRRDLERAERIQGALMDG